MGSTSKRKKNDSLIINRPRTVKGGGAGGSNSSTKDNDDTDINHICVPSFDITLIQDKLLAIKAALTLNKEKVLLGSVVVGTLSPRHRKMIEKCGSDGILYRGSVMFNSKQKVFYGRFFRTE